MNPPATLLSRPAPWLHPLEDARTQVFIGTQEVELEDGISAEANSVSNHVFTLLNEFINEEEEGDISAEEDDSLDQVFASISEAVDEGDRALEKSDALSDPKRKKQWAQSAHEDYENALQQLNQLSRDIKRLPVWKSLQQSARHGKLTADRRLAGF